jgi:hypothetical protein
MKIPWLVSSKRINSHEGRFVPARVRWQHLRPTANIENEPLKVCKRREPCHICAIADRKARQRIEFVGECTVQLKPIPQSDGFIT